MNMRQTWIRIIPFLNKITKSFQKILYREMGTSFLPLNSVHISYRLSKNTSLFKLFFHFFDLLKHKIKMEQLQRNEANKDVYIYQKYINVVTFSLKTLDTISYRSFGDWPGNRFSVISFHFGLQVMVMKKSGEPKFLTYVRPSWAFSCM